MGQMLEQKIKYQEGRVSFLGKNGSILMSAEGQGGNFDVVEHILLLSCQDREIVAGFKKTQGRRDHRMLLAEQHLCCKTR